MSVNRPAEQPRPVRPDDVISAELLNRSRGAETIVGGDGVTVAGLGGRVAISSSTKAKSPRTRHVYATIASETGSGVYTWTKVSGEGPGGGSATEVAATTGVATSSKVMLFDVGGAWYFAAPATSSSGVSYRLKASDYVQFATLDTVKYPSLSSMDVKYNNGSFSITTGSWLSGSPGVIEFPSDGVYSVTAVADFYLNSGASLEGMKVELVLYNGNSGTPSIDDSSADHGWLYNTSATPSQLYYASCTSCFDVTDGWTLAIKLTCGLTASDVQGRLLYVDVHKVHG